MRITPLGDSALVVHVCDGFEHDAERCLAAVMKALARLEAAQLAGVIEIAPAFKTLAIFFEPSAGGRLEETVLSMLRARGKAPGSAGCQPAAFGSLPNADARVGTPSAQRAFRQAAEKGRLAACAPQIAARVVDVPVCYDPEFALDLHEVATRLGLTTAEVIRRHASAIYRVACVGFTPGFPYLSGLPDELATPRRTVPRTTVAAGSVAIGGRQAGIYPHASPGGWNIIGRTPLRLFAADETPPALLAIGDAVRFRSITRAEFEALSR